MGSYWSFIYLWDGLKYLPMITLLLSVFCKVFSSDAHTIISSVCPWRQFFILTWIYPCEQLCHCSIYSYVYDVIHVRMKESPRYIKRSNDLLFRIIHDALQHHCFHTHSSIARLSFFYLPPMFPTIGTYATLDAPTTFLLQEHEVS